MQTVSVGGLFAGWYGIRIANLRLISVLMYTMISEGLLGAPWIIVNFITNSTVPVATVLVFLVFCVINLYFASYILDLIKWLKMLNEQLSFFDEPEAKAKGLHGINLNTMETMDTMDGTVDIMGADVQLTYVTVNK